MTNTPNEPISLEQRRLELKVQALLETNQNLTSTNADYRAEITMLTEYAQKLNEEVNRLNGELEAANNVVVPQEDQEPTDTPS